jgi:hypothetical protein
MCSASHSNPNVIARPARVRATQFGNQPKWVTRIAREKARDRVMTSI